MYSLTGQAVLSLKTVETNTIQLPNISNGVYILEVLDAIKGKVIRKFVKK
ncbi:T9SS type A sorting domain-containing protein [Algibacter pacificus]